MYKVVAVTGGIGSGKSAVCRYLETQGVAVYDCDSATKRLYDEDQELLGFMLDAFGDRILTASGTLDKKSLASIIFSNPKDLELLESIVHPIVLADFNKWKSSVPNDWKGYVQKEPFVVMESAIILSKPLFDGSYDAAVFVDAPLEERIKRAAKRDGCAQEQIASRISNQSFDMSKVSAVIENDGDLASLQSKTDIIFKSLYL